MRIQPGTSPVTMINAFHVAPDRAAELVRLIERAASEVMSDLPGAISNALHRSVDGTRVVNYVQWHDEASLRAALVTPAAQPLFEQMLDVADHLDHNLYEVVYLGGPATDTNVTGGTY